MKYPLILITLIFLFSLNTQAKTILLCLGQEESFYAKKHDTGPRYHLNQIMINEISAIGNPEFTGKKYKKYCSHPDKMPSLQILKALTIGNEKLFKFKTEDTSAMSLQYTMVTYDEFRLKSIKILIDYLAKLQMNAKSADCLTNNIKGLSDFYARFRYLEGEVNFQSLKGSKTELETIYNSLENIESIYKKCKK